tara:strand:- start:166 stop:522 length:357 start_codon:yes stop_codon:yes gene_type:complete
MIGAIDIIAVPPQIDDPEAINREYFLSIFRIRPNKKTNMKVDITNKDIAGKYCVVRLIALWKLIENPIRTIPVCSMIVENFLVIKFFLVTNIKLKIIPPIKAIIGILKKTLRNKKANK